MISEYDIRDKMAAVLAHKLSIVDFARWIMSNSWNMLSDSSENAISLASEVHALLAERDEYSLSDPAFLQELRDLYDNTVLSVSVAVDMASSSLPADNRLVRILYAPASEKVWSASTPVVSVPVRWVPQRSAMVRVVLGPATALS